MGDWAELVPDVLKQIARGIKLFEDLIAFGGVCSSWRSVAVTEKLKFTPDGNNPPWLMLPPPKRDSNQREWRFFSLSKGMSLPVCLPEATAKKNCFSSKGWLLTIGRNWKVSLLHPFLSLQIKLPHITTFRDWDDGITIKNVFFIQKFVISSSNILQEEDYTVMVIYGEVGKLAYFKPGFKAWTTIDTEESERRHGRFEDVIYCKDKFYAIDPLGKIFVCDLSNSPPVARLVTLLPLLPNQVPIRLCGKFYLVESSAALLAVRRGGGRYYEDSNTYLYGTHAFDVFKVELSHSSSGSSNWTWTEVKDIGNRAIFLGSNSSFSVEADDHDSICKPNCIYFTDDSVEMYWHIRWGGGRDTGIFNIQDATFVPHSWPSVCHRLNPPMWIQ